MKCVLKNINGTHPNIELNDTSPIYIGRTPLTCIQDTLVSKQHLHISPDFQTKSLSIEVLGINKSALNGTVLEKKQHYTAQHGDIIDIIPSKYQYEINFFDQKLEIAEDSHSNKRKLSVTETIVTKKIKWKIEIELDKKQPFPDDNRWESFNNGGLFVFTTSDCVGKSKIAAYDMDGTLIKTQSGKVHPVNRDDWQIAFGTVLNTIRSKVNDGFKIVILTNQAGLSSGKTKLVDLKKKMEDIAKKINVPMQYFIAAGEGYFRKPLPGMWEVLSNFKNDNVPIDLESSYYVGDAAGRPENKILKKKKDHSSVDRLLALNLTIQFYTPEEHFLKSKPEKWIQPEFNPKSVAGNLLIEPANCKLISNELEVIVMVGVQGSGKTVFCQDNLEPAGYEMISRDVIGTWQKCVERLSECLKAGKKAVIDNTNGSKEMRQRYINAARKFNVKCRCFIMTTSWKHAQHNIAFRELIDSKHSKINQMVLNTYKKNFEEPTLDEGFSEIVRVNFIPNFRNEGEKELYNMYLLSS